jgi:hypothetical protein
MTKTTRTRIRPGLTDESIQIFRAVNVALDEVGASGLRLSTDAILLALANVIASCLTRGLVERQWTPEEADQEIDAVAEAIRTFVACERRAPSGNT